MNIIHNIADESEKTILFETEDFKMGLMIVKPGEVRKKHVHRLIDEMFYVMEGRGELIIGDRSIMVSRGDAFHIEPGEIHTICNPYSKTLKMVISMTQSKVDDNVTID